MEVLVVLMLMSMLMGIGVGAFSKVGGGPQLARSELREVVASTRRHAIREKAPAVVLIDAQAGRLAGVGWRRVGCWHFEEAEGGRSSGFPVDALVGEAQPAPGGVIGNCLDLTGEISTGITIPVVSSLNSVAGISLEVFVRCLDLRERHLIGKGEFYSLDIDGDGRLTGSLRLTAPGHEGAAGAESYQIRAEEAVLPVGKWVKAALQFNGYSCVLAVDGIVLEEEVFSGRRRLLTDQTTTIRAGNLTAPFYGFLDEVRLSVAVAGNEVALPEAVRIESAPARIHFDRDGNLDRRFHTAPLAIRLRHEERTDFSLVVGLAGDIW